MWILDDLFDSTYIRDALQLVEHFGNAIATPSTAPGRHLKELGGWAAKKRTEGYHTIYTQAFVSVWAAFEACIEETLATMIRTDREAAQVASDLFRRTSYDVDQWPWAEATCLEVAKKLDQKAKEATADGAQNLAARCQTMFGWFDVPLPIDDPTALAFNEAGAVRNVILHQYGVLREVDCERFPSLGTKAGDIIRMDADRLGRYHNAVAVVYGALLVSVGRTRFGAVASA